MSQTCQQRKSALLFDHLVGVQAKRPRSVRGAAHSAGGTPPLPSEELADALRGRLTVVSSTGGRNYRTALNASSAVAKRLCCKQ
jgi:hypothetical protein